MIRSNKGTVLGIRCLICMLVVFASILLLPKEAKAKDDLYITDWLVEATILDNGDLSITEDITFEFNDEFNGVYRDIGLNKTSGVSDIDVQEITDNKSVLYEAVDSAKNGDSKVYTLKKSSNKMLVKIFSPSKNELKTFRISYIIKNVAVKYNDIAELYYKFLGDDNETAIGNFIVNIHLPAKDTGNKTKVFAHGPANGKIYKINDMQYQLQVQDVPKKTSVEGRILFPKEFIAVSNNIKTADMYNAIINEETAYQNQLLNDKVRRENIKKVLNYVNLTIIISGSLLFVYVLFKCRRKVQSNLYKDNWEIANNCTPAIASMITSSFGGSNVIYASILDLFRKGYIRISKEQEDFRVNSDAYIIYKEKDSDNLLLPHERHLMNWLFNQMGNGLAVSTSDIESYGKKNKSTFLEAFTSWRNKVKEDAKKQGFYDIGKETYGALLIIFSIAMIIFGILAANAISIFSIILGIIMLVFGIMLFNWLSDYGYEQYRNLINLKKAVKNQYKYSNIDFNSPDVSLIYALALNTLPNKVKEYKLEDSVYTNSWIFWYILFSSNDNDNSFKKTMDSSFAPIVDANSSAGFSGGGGAAAGGGGAGGF